MHPTQDDLEYLAGLEEIEIIPKFNHPIMELLFQPVGPFVDGIPLKVPLWLALKFRSENKCTVLCPEWLNTQTLQQITIKEAESQLFEKMPSEHYMTIAKIQFETCPKDIPDADYVKVILKDLWDTRLAKLRAGMLWFIEQKGYWAKVENLCQIEMCAIQPIFNNSLELLHRFQKNIDDVRSRNATDPNQKK